MAVSPETLELIRVAENWDYHTVTDEEMLKWLQQVSELHFMEMIIQHPAAIVRARCELDYTKCAIEYAGDISFLPESKKHFAGMLRCNLKGEPVFYGVLKEKMTDDKQEEIVAILESSKIANKQNVFSAKEHAVVSYWGIEKPFRAAILAHHEGFAQAHPLLEKVRQRFAEEIRDDPKGEDRVAIAKYLSSEFARPVEDGEDFKYRVSSFISNQLLTNGWDAIIYPTVRGEGIMLNIAMRKELADPNHSDNVLKLIDVEIAWAQKRSKKFEIILYKRNENDDMSGRFDFKQVKGFKKELAELQERLLTTHGKPVLYIVPKV